jgi:hypothetical protein
MRLMKKPEAENTRRNALGAGLRCFSALHKKLDLAGRNSHFPAVITPVPAYRVTPR